MVAFYTQMDSLAMPMYAIALLPLMQRVENAVTQTWYTDDTVATGHLPALHHWWDILTIYTWPHLWVAI